jgi:hypothetical protein
LVISQVLLAVVVQKTEVFEQLQYGKKHKIIDGIWAVPLTPLPQNKKAGHPEG